MTLAPRMVDPNFLVIALAHGGNPNLVVSNGWPHTPLSAAIGPGGLETVKILVQAGANINYAEPIGGNTPLTMAAGLNQYDIVYYLLEQGADYTAKLPTYKGQVNGLVWSIESTNIDSESPLHVWQDKVVEFLRSKGIAMKPKVP
jgi:ankyrin repeat protein